MLPSDVPPPLSSEPQTDAPAPRSAISCAPWRSTLAAYAQPHTGRAVLDVATSIVPYVGLCVAMYFCLEVSYVLVLALAVPAGGFGIRTFIVFHDCGHGSFLASKRVNGLVGAVAGWVIYMPYLWWRHEHAVHHATTGDLDRRGVGDVQTLTVAEYYRLPSLRRLRYRLFRNPFVMFGLGPFMTFLLTPRVVSLKARPRIIRSVIATDLTVALLFAGICAVAGWRALLLVQVPVLLVGGGAGIWLFYIQHQFEDTYWQNSADWTYADAALRGSSHLKLPKVLQFFTGNIGVHHVHHLSSRVPNYNLQRAHNENPIFHDVPTLGIAGGLRAVRLKLWDEDSQRLLTFAEARARRVDPGRVAYARPATPDRAPT